MATVGFKGLMFHWTGSRYVGCCITADGDCSLGYRQNILLNSWRVVCSGCSVLLTVENEMKETYSSRVTKRWNRYGLAFDVWPTNKRPRPNLQRR